jgi:hypothetical protein
MTAAHLLHPSAVRSKNKTKTEGELYGLLRRSFSASWQINSSDFYFSPNEAIYVPEPTAPWN